MVWRQSRLISVAELDDLAKCQREKIVGRKPIFVVLSKHNYFAES
jgi:hypothetical protein